MNTYHCVECNREKLTNSKEKEFSMKCCKGETPTKHKAGPSPKKHIPVKESVPVAPPMQTLSNPPKVTKLDQPPGDVVPTAAPAS